jgi:anti-sigma regulatory factor (Ser/Thr protein kinase)
MPDATRSAELPGGPQAPAAARTLITDWCGAQLARQVVEDIKLLVSEVVTNAVRHPGASGPIELTLTLTRVRVRIEVSDPGGAGFAKPSVSPPPPDALGGRGLLIVDRVATRWGVETGRPTRVWFELPL